MGEMALLLLYLICGAKGYTKVGATFPPPRGGWCAEQPRKTTQIAELAGARSIRRRRQKSRKTTRKENGERGATLATYPDSRVGRRAKHQMALMPQTP